MPTFKDNKGREWSMEITVATVKRVRSLCNLDLLEALGGELLPQLVADPVTLCDLFWAIVSPQAEAQGVTDEQFGEALAGDSIDHATKAFLEGLADFFARPDHRQVIRALAAKVDRAMGVASGLALKDLDELDVDQVVRDLHAEARKPPTSSG